MFVSELICILNEFMKFKVYQKAHDFMKHHYHVNVKIILNSEIAKRATGRLEFFFFLKQQH